MTDLANREAIYRRQAAFGFLLAGSLVLFGCGFHPMLATSDKGPSVGGGFAKIKVASIEGRSGQILRNDLVNVLTPGGEPDRPDYTLLIRIEEPQQNLAFQRNNSVTNVSYGFVAYWSLIDNSSGKTVRTSVSRSTQQYALSNSQYATAISAQNTRDQVALDISQDIRNNLAQYFITLTPAASSKR